MITPAQLDAPYFEVIEGFQVHRDAPLLTVGNAHFLPNLIRITGFDLIHLHYPFFGGELIGVAAKLNGCPLIITYHHDVVLRGWKCVVERLLSLTIERWLLRSADMILFTSPDYARSSAMQPHLRGCDQRINVLPNGVDLVQFYPCEDANELKQKLGFEKQDWIILLVANLDQAHYFKGVDILLSALGKLPFQVRALIVGDGDRRQQYESMALALGLGSRAVFTGRVNDEELRSFYQIADITVLPSTTRGEAFGLVLLESFACCTPVVASDLPGVRTIVGHAQEGFLVKPGEEMDLLDKVRFLFEHKEKAHEMGRRGRQKIEQSYSWQMIVDQLEEIYSVVLNDQLSRSVRSVQASD